MARINSVKTGVQKNFKELEEKAKKEKEKEQAGTTEQEKKKIVSKVETKSFSKKEKKALNETSKDEKKNNRESYSKLDISFLYHAITSDYFINTTTNIPYLKLSFSQYYLMNDLWRDLWLGGGLSYGAVVSKFDQEIPPYYNLAFFARQPNLLQKWTIVGSLTYETLNFINLPVTGQGLKASSNNVLWAKMKGEYLGVMLDKKAYYELTFGHSVFAISDYDNLDSGLSGWMFSTGITVENIYKNLIARLSFGIMKLNSSLEETAESGGATVDELVINNNIIEAGIIINF